MLPEAIVAADFNRDGKPDIVTANSGSNDVTLLLNATIVSPHHAIRHLIKYVEQLPLNHGLENALTGKLENALSSLQKNHPNAAIMQLHAFINQIEAQRVKKITESDADYLVAAAQAIIQHI